MKYKRHLVFRNYLIGSDGSVFSLFQKKTLKTQTQNSGYQLVHIRNNGFRKACTLHRLVAEMFIPNPLNKKYVNHINSDKTDNRIDNLEWVTNKENSHHAWNNGLMENAREKARLRMSEIGKKNVIANGQRLRELNIKERKPVLMLDLNGNLVREFSSRNEAEKNGFWNISRVIQGKQAHCKGYKFIEKC